jgi:hypothetical protein
MPISAQLSDRLSQFADLFAQLDVVRAELSDTLRKNSEKLEKLLDAGSKWPQLYDEPFEKSVALIPLLTSSPEEFFEAAQSENPEQFLLDHLDAAAPDTLPAIPGLERINNTQRAALAMGTLIALTRIMRAIHFYGMPLTDLVARARDQADDEALFKVLRIDPAATATPSIAKRIARASLQNDQNFFRGLKNAIGSLPKKPNDQYGQLRYILLVLHQAGELDRLSIAELCTLLCEDLGLYPYADNDAEGSLGRFIRRWKEELRT